jgi:hypothetical protein
VYTGLEPSAPDSRRPAPLGEAPLWPQPWGAREQPAGVASNARFQARRRAGARHERTLFAVACKPLFGLALARIMGMQTR